MKARKKDVLRDCLMRARGQGQRIVQIANSAGVSSTTVGEVSKGGYFAKIQGIIEKGVDARKIRGLINSLVRLALYFNLDPRSVADEYSVPNNESINLFIEHAKTLSRSRNRNTATVIKNMPTDLTIDQEDLDLLGDVIKRLGKPILLSTALSILQSLRNQSNGSVP